MNDRDPFSDTKNLERDRSRRDDAEPAELGGDIESGIEEYEPLDTAERPGNGDLDAPMQYDSEGPEGTGLVDTPLTKEYENMATRDDLARQLEDVVAAAQSWAQESADDDADDIYNALASIAERLGNPSEETDDETGMDRGD